MNKSKITVSTILALVLAIALFTDTRSDSLSDNTEVAVMGMIHGGHLTSPTWGIEQVEAAIRAFAPDVILAEIPPDRWERIWEDWSQRGAIEDSRVKRFPEYTDVLLPLKTELGFEVEPCAAWTTEMAKSRGARIKQFQEDSLYADKFAAYESESAAIEKKHLAHPIDDDDPFVIHSKAYDERTREELGPYEKHLNDFIGDGGWTNINNAHLELIEKAIAKHKGKRILITFGAGHKYMFLDRLQKRKDITLLDLKPYLGK